MADPFDLPPPLGYEILWHWLDGRDEEIVYVLIFKIGDRWIANRAEFWSDDNGQTHMTNPEILPDSIRTSNFRCQGTDILT